MKSLRALRLTSAAIVAALIIPTAALAQRLVASGKWEVGDIRGRWTARLTLDGESISGSMDMKGGPVPRAEVAGSLSLGRLDLGLIRDGVEIASFEGAMSAHGAEGIVEMADGARGRWSGTWEVERATYSPVVNGRSGAVEAPFDKPSAVPRARAATVESSQSSSCDLIEAGAARFLSLGGQLAAQAACSSEQEMLLGAGASCPAGPPASNPPTPAQVSGFLANNITRSQQVWPSITQSEVSIVATTTKAMAAYNNLATYRSAGIGVGFSRLVAGGWTENPDQLSVPLIPESPNLNQVLADPTLALSADDQQMNIGYLASQFAFGPPPAGEPLGFGASPFIGQARSDDSGNTLQFPHRAVLPSQDFASDKPWLAIDRSSNPLTNGRQYMCWTQFWTDANYQYSQIWAAWRTRDQADAQVVYPNQFPVSQVRRFATDVEEDIAHGCQVAVGPDSSAYVVWWEQIQLGSFKISAINGRRTADGLSFGPQFAASGAFAAPGEPAATQACRSANAALSALKGNIRTNPFPSLAIDPANGTIYIAHSRRPGESGSEVVLIRSTDQGATWSLPLVVHDASPGDKFMPAVAVNAFNHVVKVMWYDRRNDPNNLNIDVYGASSSDGGASFAAPGRLTASSFGVPRLLPNFDCDAIAKAGDCYMGDYNGLAGFSTTVGFVHGWGDNSLKMFDPDTNQNVPDPDVRVLAGC